MTTTETRLTLADFLRRPERKPALEFEEGMVTQKVSPRGKHSVLQYATAESVNVLLRPSKSGLAFPELRTTFAGRSLVPDVAVYAWNRIPRDASGKIADDFTTSPDIAFEIMSPGQRTNALLRRCGWFVEHGVAAAVLVNPSKETVIVVEPGGAVTTLATGDTLDLGHIIVGLKVEISALFDALRL